MTTSLARITELNRGRGRAAIWNAESAGPQIGLELETSRKKLNGYVEALSTAAPLQLATYLDGTSEVLNRLACRVAVIGQVKAGKSTFINAFIQQPGLLPTDVNPWTTAVTHLHFMPNAASVDCAARFTFFNADEWSRIIHGGGPLRELTERFVPGFGVDLLQQHVNAMRKRCEQRLGLELATLFGTSREFATIDAGTLSEYICAGDMDGSADASVRPGRYSDVVKSADLYLDSSTFCFPATLVDTPGTNDPFLVRDEITRQSLAAADIHIVVLSARQALGNADVALLNILHGLNKRNVILFINRIDELSNVGADTKKIVDDVRQRLSKTFPQTDMKIIAGSANWAQMACAQQATDITRPMWQKAQAYAVELGLHSLSPASNSMVAATVLMQCSGMPQVYNAVSGLIAESRSGHSLRQVRAAVREIAQISPPILVRSLEELIAENNNENSKSQFAQKELLEIEGAVHQSEQLLQLVHCVQVDAQARTSDIIADELDDLTDLFQQQIEEFIKGECAALRNAIASGSRTHIWKCDPEPLRHALDEIFVDQVAEAEKKLCNLEKLVRAHLQAVIEKLQPGIKLNNAPSNSMGLPAASAVALRKTIALDLGERWWNGWWRGNQDGFARATELERLIRLEFDPIIDELQSVAHIYLTARQSAGLKGLTGLCVSIFEMLRELSFTRYQRIKILTEERGEAKIIERSKVRERAIADLRKRITIIEKIIRQLAEDDPVLDARKV